ncbi:glycosyl hydrolase family 65 protein [Pedobacter vanadiisoli]|uniref:Glycosyl hydrolase family 65 protein n=1 Tax=Pedobacter vanadiisoli TaxID=1761975 RepID=A0ABW5MPB4_9SPHI
MFTITSFSKYLALILLVYTATAQGQVLNRDSFEHYISEFNKADDELYKFGDFPNEKAWTFLKTNIPFFECPDKQLEKTYYFRWWTYRKHIRNTPEGHIITEFLPDVSWAGKYNSIACAAALQFMEGRWLHATSYFEEYARFWLKGSGAKTVRGYSFWIANALENYTDVHNNDALLKELYPYLEENFKSWEKDHRDSTGFFWQTDDRDGMEKSISGAIAGCKTRGYRATINSYMFAEAQSLERLSLKLGNTSKADYYHRKSEEMRKKINNGLWDKNSSFFKVIPWGSKDMSFSDALELHGYTPWYFNIPPQNYSSAWKYLMNDKYFYAKYGPTTAAQNHPRFAISYQGHECQWNGPSWPFSTSITLTAMANLLNDYNQRYVSAQDYYKLLKIYSNSHQITFANGKKQPWIDENINPFNGDWISRTRLKSWEQNTWSKNKGGEERGKDYNHSTFNDLIITGLVGIRVGKNNELIVNPLVPLSEWDYYCLDNLLYKGKIITIYYDRTGKRYNKRKGYNILVNGNSVFTSTKPINAKVPLRS